MHVSLESSAKKSHGVLYLYRELWRLIAGHRLIFVCALSMLLGAALLELVIPYVFGRAINALQTRGLAGMTEGGIWLALVPVTTICIWLLHGPGRFLERNVALVVRERMSTGLLERLLKLPLSWHETHHTGATAHRIQQSTNAIFQFAQGQFIYLQTAVRLVGPVVALWVIAPWIGAMAVVGFTIISASIMRFDRIMVKLAREENDADRRYSATLIDALGNTTTLFALRQARRITDLLRRRLLKIFEPLNKSIVINEAKWCTVDIATRVLSCAMVAVFVWQSARALKLAPAAQNTLMLGSIYMVWEYAQRAGSVISAIASQFQTFARQQADYASADVIREAPLAHFASEEAPLGDSEWKQLALHDVTFRHNSSRKEAPALDRVNITLQRGKRYALIGGSGSGKSTLLRTLSGLYLCERISVNRDNGPALLMPADAARFLRANATLIPQDAEVLEGSLAENLALCESVTGPPDRAEFGRALELARATEFIEADDAGLESMIAERGANWSGGQRARVALARGILAAKGSGIVLLDEPTASLDSRTEAAVYENLFMTFKDACVISSIHRLHLLDRFDEVLIMQQGKLVDHGPIDELILRSPEFRQLMAAHDGEVQADASDTDATAMVN
jgi:ABC-type multidrug transport system fused ATPase/permease subunit